MSGVLIIYLSFILTAGQKRLQYFNNFLKLENFSFEVNVIMLGAGIGAILLSILWAIAFLFCFISLRTRYNIGPITVAITILVTIVLLSVPRKGDETPSAPGEKILDPFFVWRTSILLFLGLCAISSIGFVIMTSIMEIKQARPIKLWYLKP